MFGGTLAAALLVYSLLPYVRSRNRTRQHSRSRTQSQTSEDRLSWSSDQHEVTTPTTPNGASRRMWGSLGNDGIEPAGAYRAEVRETKRQTGANGSAVSGSGSELLLAQLPDFNDERGWRDFFDSQIYHNEAQEEQRTTPIPTTPRIARYRSIRDRIDRAAMEAAMDEAQTFNEFWQM
ncbi:uncharacterized protein PITG_16474 [Phytophthora infestans T30-4]|uniref:Uncharacterized protein n=1 Tax=Phytophthora infestans (strain T30-4) TaxID=403677 RepID=D0NTQ7_PHYIT|nr:uncharacterized protein PITG_16474 [Phytophthora infestans T30-4]EEY65019.1 conserved hypothetical protein [Phytophthora infestans T30-4]|eukprot:XP_002897507.1 conserved hypothetical protein [Phytophthora infestans T30-4]